MRDLTIYRLIFTKSGCYTRGVRQTPRGIQVHSTGANNPWLRRYVGPDDGRLGKNQNGNTHNRPGGDVCASAYIGKLADGTVAVYQALPWDMRCWLSGSGKNGNANRLGYVGFEICEDGLEDEEYFGLAVRGVAVLLTAHLCQMIGVTPWQIIQETASGIAYAVMDHAGLHCTGLASNHADIGTWLRAFGCSFADFRSWVEDAMKEGVNVTYIDAEEEAMTNDHPTLKIGATGERVTYLQTLLGDVGEPIGADGVFGAITEMAVRDFQKLYKLSVDGVVGPKTWAALEAATGHHDSIGADAGAAQAHAAVEPGGEEYITVPKRDWNAIKAAVVAAYQAIKDNEQKSVG